MKQSKSKKLQANMEVLKRINPVLSEQLEKEENVDWIDHIKSKNGRPNLLIRSESGEAIHTYSLEDPKAEAVEKAKELKLYKEHVSILVGSGLGYLTKELLSRMEKGHHIILVEPCGHMLKLFFSQLDVSKRLLDGSLMIAYPGKEQLATCIGLLEATSIVSGWFVTSERYVRHRPTEYGELSIFCGELLNQVNCNTGTVMSSGGKIADNDIANLPYVIRHRGVAELENLFKNKPAILVSTGPSLAKNVHHLIGMEDRAIIICVGQALRVLLGYGIKPDFACTVDFGDVNMGHFKGLMDCGVPLIALNRCYAPLLKAWQGPKFIVATPVPGFEKTAAGLLMEKGFVDQGGSVAHLCLASAKVMGCDPIVFTGQDLALSDTSHIKQVDAGGNISIVNGMIMWTVTDPRSHLYKQSYGMGPAVHVPGYFGEEVLTNTGLQSFITSFENMVDLYTNKVPEKTKLIINATQGGAHLKGTKRMALKDVIEKYCKTPIDKKAIEPLLSVSDDGNELVKKSIPLLKKDIENLDVIIKQARLGLATAHGLEVIVGRKAALTREDEKRLKKIEVKWGKSNIKNAKNLDMFYLEKAGEVLKSPTFSTIAKLSLRNYKFSIGCHEAAKKNALVGVAIYGANRRIGARDLAVKSQLSHFFKYKKDAQIRIERNKLILNAAMDAAKSLKKSYKETLKLLQKYDKTKDVTLLESQEKEPINLDDAQTFFDAGNFARPLLEARRVYTDRKYNMTDLEKEAIEVECKALKMREEAIDKAKKEEEEDNPSKLIEYVEMLYESKELGREEKYKEATECLIRAVELFPEKEEARWGLATVCHHNKIYEESIKYYRGLVDDFPENHRYRFELGQTLIDAEIIQEGLKEIGKAMAESHDFDSYLGPLGELYNQSGLKAEALIAWDEYLKKYPGDYRIKSKRDELRKEREKDLN